MTRPWRIARAFLYQTRGPRLSPNQCMSHLLGVEPGPFNMIEGARQGGIRKPARECWERSQSRGRVRRTIHRNRPDGLRRNSRKYPGLPSWAYEFRPSDWSPGDSTLARASRQHGRRRHAFPPRRTGAPPNAVFVGWDACFCKSRSPSGRHSQPSTGVLG